MINRIIVDVDHEPGKILFWVYQLSPEIWYKKTSFPIEFIVVGLSIPIKQITELPTYTITKPSKGLEPLEGYVEKIFLKP